MSKHSAPSSCYRVVARLVAACLLATSALVALPSVALANPSGGQVVAGSANIAASGSSGLNINQTTQKAIIDWRSFSISLGETTQFNQPSASAITLNRVTGVDPSQILGNLNANGQVWLINPNGILFGKTARVDVAGLLATTIDIANSDFMGGSYHFTNLGSPSAMVVNAGQITIRNAGLAALVAPGVENSGIIEANLGQIQLSSAAAFTVDLYGDGLFNFTLDRQVTQAIAKPDGTKPVAAVSNPGRLIADGGRILLTANVASSVVNHAINMNGYAQANTASVSSGVITLDGGTEGTVEVAGVLNASGTQAGQTGSTVKVTGNLVQLAPAAKIDVSGDAGGGTALVGGDMHGVGTLHHASSVEITHGATIEASAITNGNGGKIVVWSDGETNFAGLISATGGSAGGNGGSTEVSSRGGLDFTGTVDLRAPLGYIGTLLLDPENVRISANGAKPNLPTSATGPLEFDPTKNNSILDVTTLKAALALANVTVTTGTTGTQGGDITVAANVTWTGATSLTLSAYRNITVEGGVTIANFGMGNLTLRADDTGTGVGTVMFNGTGKVDFSASTGIVAFFYNPADNPAGSAVNPTSYVVPANYAANVVTNPAVANQFSAFMLVNTVADLENIENNLVGAYALGRDINIAPGSPSFRPIGIPASFVDLHEEFNGTLNGNHHTIANLIIAASSTDVDFFADAGLFTLIGPSGKIYDLSLSNANILVPPTAPGSTSIGILAGSNFGSVSHVVVSGSITDIHFQLNELVGGLIGRNLGTISDAHATVVISVGVAGNGPLAGSIGGLVGENIGPNFSNVLPGSISDSSAVATIASNSIGSQSVGGLVGWNDFGSIRRSYATGSVSPNVTTPPFVKLDAGGLVGTNIGASISQSYAEVSIAINSNANLAATHVGGLVGTTSSAFNGFGTVGSSIDQSYSIGHVGGNVGGIVFGGLVGTVVAPPATVTSSYWDIQTSGQNVSAGGVGETTAQLKAGLPAGFDPAVWAISSTVNNGYPYLKWQTVNTSPPIPTIIKFAVPGPTTPAEIVGANQLLLSQTANVFAAWSSLGSSAVSELEHAINVLLAALGRRPTSPPSSRPRTPNSPPSAVAFVKVTQPSAPPLPPVFNGVRGTLTVQLATGASHQITAYSNGKNEGSSNSSSLVAPNQCTDLIARYANALGLKSITSQTLGNGKDVAWNLAHNSSGDFQFVNGSTAKSLPMLGAVLSVAGFKGDRYGHVGIVQTITKNSDGSVTVTLFDQNFPDQLPSPHWTNITFTLIKGVWVGTLKNTNEFGTQIVPVVGWANPSVTG